MLAIATTIRPQLRFHEKACCRSSMGEKCAHGKRRVVRQPCPHHRDRRQRSYLPPRPVAVMCVTRIVAAGSAPFRDASTSETRMRAFRRATTAWIQRTGGRTAGARSPLAAEAFSRHARDSRARCVRATTAAAAGTAARDTSVPYRASASPAARTSAHRVARAASVRRLVCWTSSTVGTDADAARSRRRARARSTPRETRIGRDEQRGGGRPSARGEMRDVPCRRQSRVQRAREERGERRQCLSRRDACGQLRRRRQLRAPCALAFVTPGRTTAARARDAAVTARANAPPATLSARLVACNMAIARSLGNYRVVVQAAAP